MQESGLVGGSSLGKGRRNCRLLEKAKCMQPQDIRGAGLEEGDGSSPQPL